MTTYSLDKPRHGGQIRCTEIKQHLEKQGHEVHTLCVIQPHEVSKTNSFLVDRGSLRPLESDNGAHFPDVELHFTFRDEKEFQRLSKAVPKAEFDAVIVEQPWMFESIKRHFESLQKQPYYIYSGHNNEISLKAAIAEAILEVSNKTVEKIILEVGEIEKNAVANSDAVLAVTHSDAKHYDRLGAKSVAVAPNATRRSGPIRHPGFTSQQVQYFLFVGSAHIPNLEGFQALLGNSLSFLPPNVKILCVGSICDLLDNWIRTSNLSGEFASRIQLVGQAEPDELEAIIRQSKAILLPIQSGSGSNLKTAEALASGKPIIATTTAMRGFEPWFDSPGIFIADSKDAFVDAIVKVMKESGQQAQFQRTSGPDRPLYWDEALLSLDLNSILGER